MRSYISVLSLKQLVMGPMLLEHAKMPNSGLSDLP